MTDEGFLVPPHLVVGIQKMAAQILVSREVLGIDDRTDEQRDADRARWHAERVEAWHLYDAARPALAAITERLARAPLRRPLPPTRGDRMSDPRPIVEKDAGRAGRPRTVQREVDPIVTALQRERERQGISQTALAQRMGLTTYGTISEHERGVNQPGLDLLRRWSMALGLTLTLEPLAKAAQERYDAEHDPSDFHCLTDPCTYHPGETRLRPLPTFPAVLVPSPRGSDA